MADEVAIGEELWQELLSSYCRTCYLPHECCCTCEECCGGEENQRQDPQQFNAPIRPPYEWTD